MKKHKPDPGTIIIGPGLIDGSPNILMLNLQKKTMLYKIKRFQRKHKLSSNRTKLNTNYLITVIIFLMIIVIISKQ